MAENEEFDHRRSALNGAMGVLNSRERRIFERGVWLKSR